MEPVTIGLISVKKLWEEGVFYPCGSTVGLACDQVEGSRQVWLTPIGHCGPTDQFDISYNQTGAPGELTGLWLLLNSGAEYVADVAPDANGSMAGALQAACAGCCGEGSATLVPFYNGQFPDVVEAAPVLYTFTRTDAGSLIALQKAQLDYWSQYVPSSFKWVARNGDETTYSFLAYDPPAFLATDRVPQAFVSNVAPALTGEQHYHLKVSADGADQTPELDAASVSDLVSQLNSTSPYSQMGAWSQVGTTNQVQLVSSLYDTVTLAITVSSTGVFFPQSNAFAPVIDCTSYANYNFYIVNGATTMGRVEGTDDPAFLVPALQADTDYGPLGTYSLVNNRIQLKTAISGLQLHVLNPYKSADPAPLTADPHGQLTFSVSGTSYGPYNGSRAALVYIVDGLNPSGPYEDWSVCGDNNVALKSAGSNVSISIVSVPGPFVINSNDPGPLGTDEQYNVAATLNEQAVAPLQGDAATVLAALNADPYSQYGVWAAQATGNGIKLTATAANTSAVMGTIVMTIIPVPPAPLAAPAAEKAKTATSTTKKATKKK